MSDWISIDDFLPIDEGYLIEKGLQYDSIQVIATDGVVVHSIEFRAGRTTTFWAAFDRLHFNITHWMPLPPPPEPT